MTGGNLSLIYSLIGTPAEPETNGTILFIEEVESITIISTDDDLA